jgi:hypothetical protein
VVHSSALLGLLLLEVWVQLHLVALVLSYVMIRDPMHMKNHGLL